MGEPVGIQVIPQFDAIVLAGGRGSRMHADKLALEIDQTSLLDHALAATASARNTIVVGPRRPTQRENVSWTTEQPPGSGPASAIVHALSMVGEPIVVVIAADVPFAATAIPRLVLVLPNHDSAMLVDDAGRRQPLVAAYATRQLRERAGDGIWTDKSVGALVEGLDVVEVPARGAESLDCDTPDDLARARAAASRRG